MSAPISHADSDRWLAVCAYSSIALPMLLMGCGIGVVLAWFGGGLLTLIAFFFSIWAGAAAVREARKSGGTKQGRTTWIVLGSAVLLLALLATVLSFWAAFSALPSQSLSERDAGKYSLAIPLMLWGMQGGALLCGLRVEERQRRKATAGKADRLVALLAYYLGAVPAIAFFTLFVWWDEGMKHLGR